MKLCATPAIVVMAVCGVSGPWVAPLRAQQAATASETGPGSQFDLMFWQSIMNSRDPALYEAYLKKFPGGTFDVIARARLTELSSKPQAAAPVAAVQVTAPVQAPPAPAPVALAPPAPLPVQSVAPVAPPPTAQKVTEGRLIDNLEALDQLGRSQLPGQLEIMIAAPAPAVRTDMPPRPELPALGTLALPARFCSAEERNRFVETVFNPLLAKASNNNRIAASHLLRLRAVYDESFKSGNVPAINALAKESADYHSIATGAYEAEQALTGKFSSILAVPVAGTQCGLGA